MNLLDCYQKELDRISDQILSLNYHPIIIKELMAEYAYYKRLWIMEDALQNPDSAKSVLGVT